MILPPPLQKGDTVALVSPARFVAPAEVSHFIRFASDSGWKVRTDEVCFARHHQFGGTDAQRARHLQAMIDDPTVKAVFCTRGGYGSLRIVDEIDFGILYERPKWLVGFSDITVFHARLQALGLASLHAPMPFNFGPDDAPAFHLLRQFLEHKPQGTAIPVHELNRCGTAEGILAGGNLSILYALKGSRTLPDPEGTILFIEDVDEYLYHIDRMVLSLKRAGLLAPLAGLVVGAFTDMKDNHIPFGCTAEEIIRQHTDAYHYPVCFGFPAGHISQQQPLLLGAKVRLSVNLDGATLNYAGLD
ncbi:MAG: LD-carboxypeptidase [Bacteroidetes bacterium]|nr:LD-carboxypeptidase [Bacteroidota bacterium]